MFKKIKMIVLALSCVMLLSVPALAASYAGYTLPSLKRNNYTSSHTKTTNNKYITNRVTNLEKTDSANMWATDNGKSAVSEKVNFRKGSGYRNIYFRSSTPLYKGQYVRMGMENGEYKLTTTAFVAGDVNFQ